MFPSKWLRHPNRAWLVCREGVSPIRLRGSIPVFEGSHIPEGPTKRLFRQWVDAVGGPFPTQGMFNSFSGRMKIKKRSASCIHEILLHRLVNLPLGPIRVDPVEVGCFPGPSRAPQMGRRVQLLQGRHSPKDFPLVGIHPENVSPRTLELNDTIANRRNSNHP